MVTDRSLRVAADVILIAMRRDFAKDCANPKREKTDEGRFEVPHDHPSVLQFFDKHDSKVFISIIVSSMKFSMRVLPRSLLRISMWAQQQRQLEQQRQLQR